MATRPAAPRTPRLDRCTDPITEKLRTQVLRELDTLHLRLAELTQLVSSSSGSGASPDAPYVTYSATASLSAERRLVDGTNTTVDVSVPGQIAIDAAGGGIAGIDVEDTDQSPTVATVTELRFDSADGFVVSSPGAGIARVDLASNSLPGDRLVADSVTFAKTQNIASQRILGRNTAASGDIEELTFDNDQFQTIGGELAFGEWASDSWYANPTGSDDQPVAVEPGASLHWVGTLLEVNRVVYEVDFSSLANNTFANGTEVIDGLNWTIGNVAASQLFDISNGNGLRFRAANLTTANFTSAAQTASYAYIDLAQLIGSEYDAQAKYVFEIYVSSRTISSAESSRLYMALWHPTTLHAGGTAQLRGMSLSTNSTDTIAGTHVEATTNAITAMVMNANDVFGLTVEAMGQPTMYAGAWAAGWPAYLNAEICATTNTSTGGSLQRGDVRLVFSFNHGSAAAAVTAYTIERLRVRRA